MLGNIYFIKNSLNDMLYIGSTIRDIKDRFKSHFYDINKKPHYKLYKAMREFGFENFYILLIETIEVETKQELRNREGQYIRLIKPALNSNIAGRTCRQYQKYNIESIRKYKKQYQKDNIETSRIYMKQYQKKNVEALRNYMKQYQKYNVETLRNYKK